MTTMVPGCYFDGRYGHYVNRMVVEFARDKGMVLDEEDAEMVGGYDQHHDEPDFPHERLLALVDESEQFMNDTFPVEGHAWMFHEGDYGVFPVDDDGD